jgi:RNA polymerase sigma-70 factor, ECF subfamily
MADVQGDAYRVHRGGHLATDGRANGVTRTRLGPVNLALAFFEEACYVEREQFSNYIAKLTRDRELAEDLVQESYARLVSEIKAGRPPGNPRAWLYRVARNLAISGCRRQFVAARAAPKLRAACSPSAEEYAVVHEAVRELDAELRRFCWLDRTSVLMAAEGYSRADIAQVVGRSEGAVRTRICRARQRLRMRLVDALDH